MPTLGCPPFCCFLLCTLLGRSVVTRRVADSIACTLLRSAPALWFNDPPFVIYFKMFARTSSCAHCNSLLCVSFVPLLCFVLCLSTFLVATRKKPLFTFYWAPLARLTSLTLVASGNDGLPFLLASWTVSWFLSVRSLLCFVSFRPPAFLFVLYGPPLWPYGPPNCRHYANSGPKDWQSTRCRPMVERTHWTAFTCWTNFGPCRL